VPSMMFIPLDMCSPMASVVAQEMQQQSQQFLGMCHMLATENRMLEAGEVAVVVNTSH